MGFIGQVYEVFSSDLPFRVISIFTRRL